jgi:hypothetical protein
MRDCAPETKCRSGGRPVRVTSTSEGKDKKFPLGSPSHARTAELELAVGLQGQSWLSSPWTRQIGTVSFSDEATLTA